MQDFTRNKINFSNYIKNKKIIIVGPSKSLEGKNLGKIIDSYDIVIRLNNSYPISLNKNVQNDLGTRTDILYHTGAIKKVLGLVSKKYNISIYDILKQDKIKFFVSKRNPNNSSSEKKYILEFLKIIKFDMKIVTFNKSFLVNLRKNLKNTEPNMSTIAFLHLAKFKFKECRIIGCDFYSTGYNNGYFIPDTLIFDNNKKQLVRKDGRKRRKPKIPHNTKIQIKFLLKALKNDKRFIIDDINKWKKKIVKYD
jgi:hypothetical protein